MRLLFPDESSRLLYTTGAGQVLVGATGPIAVFSDAAGQTPADIQTPAGVPITNGVVQVGADSMLPDFLGPDNGAETLYVRPFGGAVQPIYASTQQRLDTVEDRVAGTAKLADANTWVGAQTFTGGSSFTAPATGVPLKVQLAAGASGNAVEVRDSAGVLLSRTGPTGVVFGHVGVYVGPQAGLPADGILRVAPSAAAERGVVIRLASAQTANAVEVQSSSGVVLAAIEKDGALTAKQLLADPDTAGKLGLRIRLVSGHTANAIEVQNSLGTAQARIANNGAIFTNSGFYLQGNGVAIPANVNNFFAATGAGITPLGLQAFSGGGQTGPILNIFNATGSTMFAIEADGRLQANGHHDTTALGSYAGAWYVRIGGVLRKIPLHNL